jgi:hypothetical protein
MGRTRPVGAADLDCLDAKTDSNGRHLIERRVTEAVGHHQFAFSRNQHRQPERQTAVGTDLPGVTEVL